MNSIWDSRENIFPDLGFPVGGAMYAGRTLFSQIMDFVPWTSFNRIVTKYRGDVGVRTLRCTEHFRVMAFAQVTGTRLDV